MKLCRMIVGVGMILALAGAAQAATLIGYWGFEEGSGTTTADGTGNNPDAILNGGAGWSGTTPSQLSHSSQSVEILDGSNGYVNLGNPAGLDSATDWSVSIWAYLISDPGYDHRGIISKRTGYSGKDWDSYIPDASTTGFLFRVAGQNLSGDVTMADWSHILVTKSGTTYTLYVDGSVADSGTSATAVGTGDNVYVGVLGGDGTTDEWNGYLDDVSVWDGALSPDDVTALWNGANPIPEPTTIALLGLGCLGVLMRRRKR